jgi:hypothetical protein
VKEPEASPKLFFQPAFIFDSECEHRTGFKVDSALREELLQKLPIFRAEWTSRAGALISASEKVAGRFFQRKEYSVALTLCKWTPMGDPAFIVSARPYLGAARTDRAFSLPMKMAAFVSMTHHELLHSLVDNLIHPDFFSSSSLLEKYRKETFNVQVHLHLMAIQKAVNELLGDKKLIEATKELYAYIGGDYQRTWDIIDDEGAQKFLDEIKKFNSQKDVQNSEGRQ